MPEGGKETGAANEVYLVSRRKQIVKGRSVRNHLDEGDPRVIERATEYK